MTDPAHDSFGWPIRMLDGERVCARVTDGGHYSDVMEFRIDGYCSPECRDMAEVEAERDELLEVLARQTSRMARLANALEPAANARRETIEQCARIALDYANELEEAGQHLAAIAARYSASRIRARTGQSANEAGQPTPTTAQPARASALPEPQAPTS